MKHGSLFNGIGGFQLAAEWMGWENVFSCEIDKFCNKVTKYHFPNCIQHEDIRTTDFSIYRGAIDIVTGGFPCQTFSLAGRGAMDLSLWKEMLRAVEEIRPGFVVAENVYGLVNRKGGVAFDQVQTDLENAGYETASYLLPACGVNAPHRRERVWIIAYSDSNGRSGENAGSNEKARKEKGLQQQHEMEQFKKSNPLREFFTHSKEQRFQKRNEQSVWDESYAATKRHDRICEWENFPTQSALYNRNDGLSYELDTKTLSSAKWRTESIKALGNAIVPQVAYEIFKAIELVEMNEASQGTVKREQTGD